MDIYEFSQVLWRRKWFLLSGFAVLLVLVAASSLDFSDGVKLRVSPKFQAQAQIAVVPYGYNSLARELGASGGGGTALVFASLLASPQAALEIADEAKATLLEFDVSATGRDRFVLVNAISDTPEGAVGLALGSFGWLEQRLAEPLLTASAPETEPPVLGPIDNEGIFRGNVRLDIDHSLASNAEGLWIVTRTGDDDRYAFRLADAADEASVTYQAAIIPGEKLTVSLEDASGAALDTFGIEVPPFPDAGEPYELVLGFSRGLVRGSVEEPKLDVAYAGADWSVSSVENLDATSDVADVSILLLTDSPFPQAIGGRKAPLLIMAMLTVGVIGLLVVAVLIDSWSRERRRRKEADSDFQGSSFHGASSFAKTVDEIDEILGRVSS